MNYFFIIVYGGVSISNYGPFDSEEERDAGAQEYLDSDAAQDDILFKAEVSPDGEMTTSNYLEGELGYYDEEAPESNSLNDIEEDEEEDY